jgi:hypothetical protein
MLGWGIMEIFRFSLSLSLSLSEFPVGVLYYIYSDSPLCVEDGTGQRNSSKARDQVIMHT